MAKAFKIALFSILFACTLAVFAAPISGDHAGQSVTVDGMVVHLGLMPAEVLRQHPEWYPEHEQSAIPSGKHFYHVMLALFDNSTGARIAESYGSPPPGSSRFTLTMPPLPLMSASGQKRTSRDIAI